MQRLAFSPDAALVGAITTFEGSQVNRLAQTSYAGRIVLLPGNGISPKNLPLIIANA